jgi:hypothetical protein
MRCAIPLGHGLFIGLQPGRHAAVAVTVALAALPCAIVTAAMLEFLPA